MQNAVVLELRNISKYFPGVVALDQVNFQLKKGTTHVLCGENGAGKSTLMKIVDGLYSPDAGDIVINGEKTIIRSPVDARRHGIAMITQELSYIPDLTVEENIFLGRWPLKKGNCVDWKTIRRRTTELLQKEGLPYLPQTKLRSLSISDIQMIEIIKAVSEEAEVIIMDEPTSAITSNEVAHLFRKIEELKARGASIIYISHKMEEIFQIADEITILRDGKSIATRPVGDYTVKNVIELMVGRKMENQYPKETVPIPDDVILKVTGLSNPGVFEDIDFEVKKGEIVGFSGLMGAGRTEVMRALFGLDPYRSGQIEIRGEEMKIKNVKQSIDAGMVMLSEDRKRYGVVPLLTVSENTALASLEKFIYRGLWYKKKEQKTVRDICQSMGVKTPSMETKVFSLSGGNQQKVILGKWMIREPDILIADEPTRGIDVGAKSEIYRLMTDLVKQGKGIVMVSSELPELIGMCDRIYVMHDGKISGMLERKDFSQEAIMSLAVASKKGGYNETTMEHAINI